MANDDTLDAENSTKAANVYRFTVPAGTAANPGVRSVDVRGKNYFVIYSAGINAVSISTDKSGAIPQPSGTGSNFTPYFRFNQLTVSNTNAYDVSVVLWAGFGEYVDRRTFVREAASKILIAAPGGTPFSGAFAATTSYILSGVPASVGTLGRRSVIVSNLDPANSLQILDETGAIIGYVPPVQVLEFVTAGVFTVRNNTGGAINGALSESWFYQT